MKHTSLYYFLKDTVRAATQAKNPFPPLLLAGITLFTASSYGSLPPSVLSSEAAPAVSQPVATHREYSPESREYHLKGAFLRYVAKFIEWPNNTLKGGAINICVIGLVPYYKGISSINGKVINEQTLIVNRISSIEEAPGRCQLVFVAKTEEEHIKKVLQKVKAQAIVTFGDMEGFAEQGGHMNFYIANNRLAIIANLAALDKSHLKINPEILRLITIVPPHGSGEE